MLSIIIRIGIVSAIFLQLNTGAEPVPRRITISGRGQGTTYSIVYYADDTLIRKVQIDSLLNKMNESLSVYKPGSLINRFNKSKKGIVVDQHLRAVVLESINIYYDTEGLFDITIMPITEAWGFGTRRNETLPDSQQIRKILPCIGTQLLNLQANKLRKSKACTRIDVNGIAQGYTVDLIAERMEKAGIKNYVVELGGEIRVKGKRPGNQPMKVAIESPRAVEQGMEHEIYTRVLEVPGGAITTSGNYRPFHESGGRHINHIFDPRTGYSIDNELIAVTIFAPTAMIADGYDNAVMGMGLASGLAFLSKNKRGLEGYFIYKDQSGNIRDTATSGFYKLMMQPSGN